MKFQKIIKLIREIYGEGFIPLHRPSFSDEEKNALIETIDSNFVSSAGKHVEGFENDLARYTGIKNCAVTVNGTSALHASLHVLGVDDNSEVITQALTFVATANAIKYTGADIAFLDVEKNNLGLSAESLKTYLHNHTTKKNGRLINIRTNKIIKACVPMHTFGFPCNMNEIVNICRENKIYVVEDCAESLGSFIKDKHTGSFGDIGTLSFNGNKLITTGGGGAILTENKEIYEKVKHITTTAKQHHRYEYFHDVLGFNYRMPNLNASIGRTQLKVIDKLLLDKRKVHEIYYDYFSDHNSIEILSESEGNRANYWLNVVKLKNKEEKASFLEELNDNEIMTRPLWVPLNRLPMYEECYSDELKNTNHLYDVSVNLPSSAREVDYAKIL